MLLCSFEVNIIFIIISYKNISHFKSKLLILRKNEFFYMIIELAANLSYLAFSLPVMCICVIGI